MKRELAALLGGSVKKTRGSKEVGGVESNGASVGLVYKRVKRSVPVIQQVDLVTTTSDTTSKPVLNDLEKDREIDTPVKSIIDGEEQYNGVAKESTCDEDNGLVKSIQTNEEVNNSSDIVNVVQSPSIIIKKKEKNSCVERCPKRFTRSSLKSKDDDALINANESVVQDEGQANILNLSENNMDGSLKVSGDSVMKDKENTEPVVSNENVGTQSEVDKEGSKESMLAPPKKKMEMKMSKHIALAKIPTNVKELLETGLLEGCPVYYNGGKGIRLLQGRIRGHGILCSCGLCKDRKVIPPSLFEIHACDTYKRAAQYINLENGRSFIDILKACKTTRLGTLEATVQNAIGPVPERKLISCLNCREPFSTMDAECSDAVCSSCVVLNLSPIGPVFSNRRLLSKKKRSSKSACPLRPSQDASACDVHPDRSEEKSIEKLSESGCPLKPSKAASPCDGLLDGSQKKSIGKEPEAFLAPKLRCSPRFEKSSETMSAKQMTKKRLTSEPVRRVESLTVEGKKRRGRPRKVWDEHVKRDMMDLHLSEDITGDKRSLKAASPTVNGTIRAAKSSHANDSAKRTKRLKKEVLTPKPLKSPSIGCSSEKKTSGKITRKDLRLHKLVFEDDILPDGTELGYYVGGKKLLDGYKKGSGIFCCCCETVVSASQFEAHAGCASRRKPYCYIYTSNGISLHELSINLMKDRMHSSKFNDDLCSICADGGDLLLCDGCPRAFHMECASLSSLPHGKWYCKYCQNMFEREKFVAHNANAVAAGRISGVDPMEQITTRSIRIVDTLASELSSCILCRGYDFCKSGFGPRTIILCDQCEKEYHVGCLKEHNMADLTELPEGNWFCGKDCGRIESSLKNLLVQGAVKLPEFLVDTIRKKHVERDTECTTNFDVSWRLLSGKIASTETRPLLSQAVAIFHESFSPIIDAMSQKDLIAAMVYGRSVAGQEYGGVYSAVLTVNSVVVSAGIFRVFGPDVAELPLVATSTGNQGKGYFQALFSCIERLLGFLQVKSLVLPAAEESVSIWTDRFGFTKMTPDQLQESKRNYWSIVRFQGTSMLHKSVPECRNAHSLAEFGFL